MILYVIGCIIVLCSWVYYRIQQKQNLWQKAGVEVPPSLPILGHYVDSYMKPLRWERMDKLYKKYKDQPYWGMYELTTPWLYVKDLNILRDILVKESHHFMDRRAVPFNQKGSTDTIYIEMLTHCTGNRWKNLRTLITPTFTSGKIKAMFSSISTKTDQFLEAFEEQVKVNSSVEVNKPIGAYTMSVIADAAFGIQTPMSDEENEFTKNAKKISDVGISEVIKFFCASTLPTSVTQRLNIELAPIKATNYLSSIVHETIGARKKQNIRREDFLDLLEDCLEFSEKTESEYRMTMKSVVAQSLLFLVAGQETTSQSLVYTLYLLAKNPEAQDILRKELEGIDEMTYQSVTEAHYLDACLSETLRIYNPAHFTERKCTNTFTIEKTGLVVPKGALINIPMWSIHRDEEFWNEPYSFKPERFLPENKDKIVPFSYLAFGSGPRKCIGMRFALLEMKVFIAKFILKYRLSIPEGDEELVFNPDPFMMKITHHGVRLNVEEI